MPRDVGKRNMQETGRQKQRCKNSAARIDAFGKPAQKVHRERADESGNRARRYPRGRRVEDEPCRVVAKRKRV